MPTSSYWQQTAAAPAATPLSQNITVDAAVIGGGHTGIIAAYLLCQAGLTVAIFEKDRCCQADTGHTSAHLTYVCDLRLPQLITRFGQSHAQSIWHAGSAAIDKIENIIHSESIDCDFVRVPGYLHAAIDGDRDERDDLRRDAAVARELGFPAEYVEKVPMMGRPGILFPNQARYHPLKFAHGMLKRIAERGGQIFEQTEVRDFDATQPTFTANGYSVDFDFVFIATSIPLMGRAGIVRSTLLQSKIAPYTSYVIGATAPLGSVPDALFWDTSDPYYYLRIQQESHIDYVVFGGCDHKTAERHNHEDLFAKLSATLQAIIPNCTIRDRWSGQVIESRDGLPLLGMMHDKQYVATGYSGNGLTFGTLGAMILSDAAGGRTSPWESLFDLNRTTLGRVENYI